MREKHLELDTIAMNQDLEQKLDIGVAKNGNMIKLRDILSEDLFGTSLKLKPYEALMVKSVVSFMMDKYNFTAKIIINSIYTLILTNHIKELSNL